MDHQTAAGAQETDDEIAGDGPAALPEIDHHAFGAGNEDRDFAGIAAVGEICFLLRRLRVPGGCREAFRHQRRGPAAEPDVGKELVTIVETELVENVPSSAFRQLSQREVLPPERLVEQPPPEVDCLVAVKFLQVATDIDPRLAGDDEVDPGGIGPGLARRHDLHRLSRREGSAQGRGPSVDSGRLASVPDVRVDRVCEVDRGRAARELEYLSDRGEHEHRVREQVDLHVLDELDRVPGRLLHLEYLAHPGAGAPVRDAVPCVPVLVQDMGRDSGFRDLVHFVAADLHLDGQPARSEQHRVQRLVAVRLRNGDVVLEPARPRFVEIVHGAEHAVAHVDTVHQDADAVHVEHLFQGKALGAHLPVDAVDVLVAAEHPRLEPLLTEPSPDGGLDVLDRPLAVAPGPPQLGLDHPVAVGVQGPEAKILELLLHVVEPEADGDGSVDLEGLARDPPPPFDGQGIDGAHVVETVGELDEHDPHVVRHREQHLAVVLGLHDIARGGLDLGQLGHPVHQLGNFLSEVARDALLVDRRVLHHVVEHPCDDALGVEPHPDEDPRDLDRVGDVGIAGRALLSAVGLRPEEIGPVDGLYLRRVQVRPGLIAEVADRSHLVMLTATGDSTPDTGLETASPIRRRYVA